MLVACPLSFVVWLSLSGIGVGAGWSLFVGIVLDVPPVTGSAPRLPSRRIGPGFRHVSLWGFPSLLSAFLLSLPVSMCANGSVSGALCCGVVLCTPVK